MTFSQVNAEYVQLRNSLSTFVGEGALDEVSVQPPASEDEASFLRLIAWSYALTFEVGRVSIPYLLKQPAENDIRQREARSARDLVNNLRTWSFHNLGLHSDRSIRISSDVSLWFIQICGSNPPQNNEDWQSCFESLCSEVSSILTHCRDALNSVLADPDNKSDVITVLNQRIDRSWPAHKFDAIVGDAAMRMGLTIDVVEFRSRRLNKWRQYLETIPVDDAPEMLVVRLIERDLLEHYRAVLPIDSNDVMAALELQPGQDVALAMSIAYRMFDSGLSDPVRLLAELEQWHASRK